MNAQLSRPTVDAANDLPKSHTLFLSKEGICQIEDNYKVTNLSNNKLEPLPPIFVKPKRSRPKKSK